MPHPIPLEDRLRRILVYIGRRQIELRPTTLWQIESVLGIGVDTLRAVLEEKGVEYLLISYFEKKDNRSTEILISSIPDYIYPEIAYVFINVHRNMETGITPEKIKSSYQKLIDLAEVEITTGPKDQLLSPEQAVDIAYGKRLNKHQFEVMSHGLIKSTKLRTIIREKGYSKDIYNRITNKYNRNFASYWNPYIYDGDYYFVKEVLNHLLDLEKFYKREHDLKASRLKRKRVVEQKKLAAKTASKA